MQEHNPRTPGIQILTPEEERGYAFNRHLELGLRSENIRLRKALNEKNLQMKAVIDDCTAKMQSLVEKYRKHDDQRKAHYARFEEEYDAMKEYFDSFSEELREAMDDESFSDNDRKAVLKLYQHWYSYKKESATLRGKISTGRQGIKGILKDAEILTGLVQKERDIHNIEAVTDRVAVLRQHLDTLKTALEE